MVWERLQVRATVVAIHVVKLLRSISNLLNDLLSFVKKFVGQFHATLDTVIVKNPIQISLHHGVYRQFCHLTYPTMP
jgi:hypothetical protein